MGGFLSFLGLNPFKIVGSSTLFVEFCRVFSNKSFYLSLEWAKKLISKAAQWGYRIEVDPPQNGWGWHMHLIKANGDRLNAIHLQITEAVYRILQALGLVQ